MANLDVDDPLPEFDLISQKEDVLAKSFIYAARGSNSYRKELDIRLNAEGSGRRL